MFEMTCAAYQSTLSNEDYYLFVLKIIGIGYINAIFLYTILYAISFFFKSTSFFLSTENSFTVHPSEHLKKMFKSYKKRIGQITETVFIGAIGYFIFSFVFVRIFC